MCYEFYFFCFFCTEDIFGIWGLRTVCETLTLNLKPPFTPNSTYYLFTYLLTYLLT